jgi:hypothetical protein
MADASELAFEVGIELVGLGVAVRSNRVGVVHAAQAAFAGEAIGAVQAHASDVQIDIIVEAAQDGAEAAKPFTWRKYGATALAVSGTNVLTAQLERGYGLAFVTLALADDATRLCAEVIEPLALEVARGRDRAPIQATVLTHDGRVIVLLGATRAERTALADALVQAGFTLFALEVVYVSCARGLWLWGTARMAEGAPAVAGAHTLLCVVERVAGRASRLEPAGGEAVPAALRAAGAADEVERAFTAQGAYRLLMGSEPRSAVALLRHITL